VLAVSVGESSENGEAPVCVVIVFFSPLHCQIFSFYLLEAGGQWFGLVPIVPLFL
jgi:hypothetical protein